MATPVGPEDVRKQLIKEFPNTTVTVINQNGLDAEFKFAGEMIVEARVRAADLARRARLFNAHLDHGHAGNKRNWWKRIK